ncbi:hypothetical protein SAMN02745229_01281 [Butyrivibrio fibrisolvens DSM 3071]|uniref:Uncharacterized protein n=1 Tax=Butyrivibrio fibrisolvens DSM 3071 TaxID=1121131 RepID=A0A1M5X483_BUTFI|nr:hypothetical protein [Butyrivibrio fibrisolvens]SHH94625.1 hypothetical protein SAMN02745229_01281 [Butyrivibrio fibrisolvens DSM 3071]
MAPKNSNVLARVEIEVKEEAESILNDFNAMMEKGLVQAKTNESRPAKDVLSDIRNNVSMT